jgi:hypothetical protein
MKLHSVCYAVFFIQFNGTPHPNPSPEKEGRYMVLEAPLIKERGWG